MHKESSGDVDIVGARAFWGYGAAIPDANTILTTFEYRDQDSAAGDFVFAGGAGGQYLFFALPQGWGAIDAFYFNNFPVVFTRTEVTLLIGTDEIAYYVYQSPEPQNGADLELTIPSQ